MRHLELAANGNQAVTGSRSGSMEINPPSTASLADWSAQIETRTGLKLNVRSASPNDEQTVIDFFRQITPEELRFRFLSSLKAIGSELAHELVEVDHIETENLLAFNFEDGSLVASAMLAADDKASDAEVAVAVRSDFRGQGVGWAMLHHACDFARVRGFKRVHSIELSDNRSGISLEEEMGFKAHPCPDDMTLMILSKDLDAA
jgi:GNAT superfamily N-acetyltransferase